MALSFGAEQLLTTVEGGFAIKMAGVKTLNSFPQCTSVANLGQHHDAWEDLFTEMGAGLDSAPIITDLLDHPDVISYGNIMRFCRCRTDHCKEHDLCEQAKKRILARTCIHAMSVVEQQPEIDALGALPEAAVDKSSAAV